MDGIALRCDLRPGDVGEIVRWHGVTYACEHGFNSEFEGYVATKVGAFAEDRPARSRLWLAERDGRLVGLVAIVPKESTPETAESNSAQLRWFLVDPSVRRQGLGTRLIGEALAFARERGYRRVSLWTVAELTAATRLYRAARFELAEEVPGHHWGVDVVEQRYERML